MNNFVQAINDKGKIITTPIVNINSQLMSFQPFGEKHHLLGCYINGVAYHFTNNSLVTTSELMLIHQEINFEVLGSNTFSSESRFFNFTMNDLTRKDIVSIGDITKVESSVSLLPVNVDASFVDMNVSPRLYIAGSLIDVEYSLSKVLFNDDVSYLVLKGVTTSLPVGTSGYSGLKLPFVVSDIIDVFFLESASSFNFELTNINNTFYNTDDFKGSLLHFKNGYKFHTNDHQEVFSFSLFLSFKKDV